MERENIQTHPTVEGITMDQKTLEKMGGKVKWIEVPFTTTGLSATTGKDKWQSISSETIVARVDVGAEAEAEAVFNATQEWLKQIAVKANKPKLDKLLAAYNVYHGEPSPKEIVREVIKEAGLEGDTSEYTNIKGKPHKLCTIHNEWMPQRENEKGKWFSHKDGDDWCRGD